MRYMCAFMRVKGYNIYNAIKVVILSLTSFTSLYPYDFQSVKCKRNM